MNNYPGSSQTNLIKKALTNWYWYVACLAIAIAAAWYDLATQSPTFFVKGSIIVEEDQGRSGQLPEESIIQGLPFKNKGSLDRQIQVFKSRNLMEKVVDSLGIDVVYYIQRRFKEEELYKDSPIRLAAVSDRKAAYGKRLTVNQLDDKRFSLLQENGDTTVHAFGEVFAYEGLTFSLVRDTLNPKQDEPVYIKFIPKVKVATWYSEKLMFQKQAQSNVISVSLTDISPRKLQDILYELVDVYNYVAQDEKNRMAARSLRFIDTRLADMSSELFAVESSQASLKTSTAVTTDVDASAERYLDKLSSAETDRAQITATQNTIRNLRDFLTNFDNQYALIPSFGDLGGVSFASSIAQYNKVISAREAKLVTATARHPEVIQAEETLRTLRATILRGIDLVSQDLAQKERQVTSSAAPIQQKVNSLPFVQQRLKEIERKVGVKDDLVLYMLKKREETAIGLATKVESTRILDDPISSDKPVTPNSGQTYMLAILLALALPTGVLFLKDKLNDKITDKSEVKAMANVPFLGEIALAKSERGKLITAGSRSAIAEMFRLIRTNLEFLTAGGKEKVILVTSNESGDGKTFVSGNLGAVLALTNKKTVLMELDLRKPKLTESILGKPSTVGITNYLVGEAKMKDIVQKLEGYDNLYLISSGPTPPNPAELLMGTAMEELVEKLKADFDYVVLDTPPVGLVADAFLLKKFANTSIFVVRAAKTKKDDLKAAADICESGKLAHPAFVLNGVKTPKRYGYYY